jgi:hypothetical protein
MKWRYGDAWEHFPIEAGEVWGTDNGSRVAVHNIFNPLPTFMTESDMIFVDPPWNQGNLTSFYTKAYRDDYQNWTDFEDVLFQRIRDVNPVTCYIEIGNQYVDAWYARLGGLFTHLQRWDVVYYHKHPTNIIRGSQDGPTSHDFAGMDEAEAIEMIGEVEDYKILGDLCMGQGLVGVAAYKSGRPFVGTELNKRRLANLIQKTAKLGAHWQRCQ